MASIHARVALAGGVISIRAAHLRGCLVSVRPFFCVIPSIQAHWKNSGAEEPSPGRTRYLRGMHLAPIAPATTACEVPLENQYFQRAAADPVTGCGMNRNHVVHAEGDAINAMPAVAGCGGALKG